MSQSSERPGRAAAHYPQKQNPADAGSCQAHRTAGDRGGSGLSERLWPLVVPPSATVQTRSSIFAPHQSGRCLRPPELKGHGVNRQFALSPAKSRSSRRSRQGTRMRSAHPRSAGAELLSLPAVCSCTAGTQSYPVFLVRPPPSNPYASTLTRDNTPRSPRFVAIPCKCEYSSSKFLTVELT